MTGDGGGAKQALHEVGEEAGSVSEIFNGALKGALGSTVTTFSSLETAAEKAAEVLKDFFKESIDEFAKAEQVTNQLRAAAGQYTAAIQEQAEAQSKALNVKVEDIEHMDTLLLRYGAAPSAIGAATEAVENYAKATGTDANGALMQLIRGVEAGHGSLGRMGVQFKATGDFSKDLGSAVDALNEKFGGAAATDAQGLAGRSHAVGLAMDELKKTFGAMFDDLDKRTGLLDTLAKALQGVNDQLKSEGLQVLLGLKQKKSSVSDLNDLAGMFGETAPAGAMQTAQAADARAAAQSASLNSQLKASGVIPPQSEQELPDTPLFDGSEKQGKDKLAAYLKKQEQLDEAHMKAENEWLAKNDKFHEQELEQETKHDDEMLKKKFDADREMLDEADKYHKALVAQIEKSLEEEEKSVEDDMKFQTKAMQDIGVIQADVLKQQNDQQRSILAERTSLWTEVGTQMGTAIIQGIQSAFQPSGGAAGKPDLAATLAGSILGIMGSIMPMFGALQKMMSGAGSAYSTGDFGAFAGSLGSVGSSGTSFMKGGKGDGTISDQQFNESYKPPPSGEPGAPGDDYDSYPSQHSGGWMRFHRGGWPSVGADEVPIIAQMGERVLSRNDVSNMGGPSAVDAAARGGGGKAMNVYAWDTQSLMDFMGKQGGRGMLNTVRTGKGPMREMFGGT